MFFYKEVVIVGDSIIKDIRDIEGITVTPFPSATIGALAYVFEVKKIKPV